MLPCSPRRRWRRSGSLRTCLDTQNRACMCGEGAVGRGGWQTGRLSWSWSSGFQLLQTHKHHTALINKHSTEKATSQHWREIWAHDARTPARQSPLPAEVHIKGKVEGEQTDLHHIQLNDTLISRVGASPKHVRLKHQQKGRDCCCNQNYTCWELLGQTSHTNSVV